MQISRINQLNTYRSTAFSKNTKPKQQVSFKSGKVDAYFDFDMTYCPVSQHSLRTGEAMNSRFFNYYCNSFRDFIEETKNSFKFHIITGRTLMEYEIMSRLVRECGYNLPLPNSLITKNGSDEYINEGSDIAFYVNGEFPFTPKSRNIEKEEDIKALTNWDGVKIQNKIKEILASHDLKIYEADSEMPASDHGDRSLFSWGKLNYEDHSVSLYDGMPPTSEWNVGIRNDGNCKVFFTLPYDTYYVSERKDVLDSVLTDINQYFIQENIDARIHICKSDSFCGGRPTVAIEPMVNKNIQDCPSIRNSDKGLTKLYDTRKAVEKASKNNDLVIVAGDSSNDFTMLNPIMYLDIDADKYPKLYDLIGRPIDFMRELKTNKAGYQEISNQLKDLPFMGIVVKNNDESSPLQELVDAFWGGNYKKIIVIENGELESGVMRAISLYSHNNPNFKKCMLGDVAYSD